jgi:hypothetical protein
VLPFWHHCQVLSLPVPPNLKTHYLKLGCWNGKDLTGAHDMIVHSHEIICVFLPRPAFVIEEQESSWLTFISCLLEVQKTQHTSSNLLKNLANATSTQ